MRRDRKAGFSNDVSRSARENGVFLAELLTGKGIWYSSNVDEADLLVGIDSDEGCKRSSSVWISTSLTTPRTLSSGRNRPLMLLFLLNCLFLNKVGVLIFLAWISADEGEE